MDNFTSGRFIHGDDGFDPRFGAAYILKVNSTGNGPVYTTWADFFKGSFGTSPTVPAEGIMGTPTSPYGYAANAKAAVASIFSATQSPDAMEAFGFLAKSIVQAKGAVSFFGDPTWNIAPKLSDGTHLNFDSIRITSSSGNQTLNGSDINELVHGSSGNDTISGGKGIDILFGGDGDDGLNGGPGDDFLYGGNGNDRISGSAGNDYLKGNAGSDTFVFGADAGGRDRIGDFRPGTDFLEIKSDLNGNGLKSASQVLGTATTDADSNAVLHLGGGVEIVLIGVHASDLKADMIHMN
jgi:Ca2+-binding RTX toxin-like protein